MRAVDVRQTSSESKAPHLQLVLALEDQQACPPGGVDAAQERGRYSVARVWGAVGWGAVGYTMQCTAEGTQARAGTAGMPAQRTDSAGTVFLLPALCAARQRKGWRKGASAGGCPAQQAQHATTLNPASSKLMIQHPQPEEKPLACSKVPSPLFVA
jgi:hypothetical protein